MNFLKVILALIAALWFGSAVGCAEIEKNKMSDSAAKMTESIAAAAKAGISNGIRDFQAQAGMQAINPAYKFNCTVVVGTAVIVDGTFGLDGVSGQMQYSAASGRDIVNEPTDRPPVE